MNYIKSFFYSTDTNNTTVTDRPIKSTNPENTDYCYSQGYKHTITKTDTPYTQQYSATDDIIASKINYYTRTG